MPFLIPSQLTILTTSKCTARCGHCSMNSAPERHDRLSFEQMRTAIDELHRINHLKVVVFAGGEPVLLGEELLDAIAYADSLGIITRIVTNAYWASSPKRAREKLIELREAGLQELNFSADDYHLPFIPFKRVEYAWRASKGLGFRAVVIANCYGPTSRVTPNFIMEQLCEDLGMRFDDGGISQPLPPPAPDGTIYAMSNSYLQNLGRATNYIQPQDLIYPLNQADLDTPCPWAIRSAALSPKNHLVACCGIEAEHNEVLDFGDGNQSSIAELAYLADEDVIANAIALLGPMKLKHFIQKRAPEIYFRERYATVCEICEHIVNRPECVKVLRDYAGELAMNVLTVRS